MGQEERIKEGIVVRKERYRGVEWGRKEGNRRVEWNRKEGYKGVCCVGRKEGTEKRKFHLKEGKQPKTEQQKKFFQTPASGCGLYTCI